MLGKLDTALYIPTVAYFSAANSCRSVGYTCTICRFNKLAWSPKTTIGSGPSATRGVLAAGMETGEVYVWDVQKILDGKR